MKCFVIAHCKSEVRVMIPVFKSVDDAVDYCLRVFKYKNEILMCEVYSALKNITRHEATVHNLGTCNKPVVSLDDDDLSF